MWLVTGLKSPREIALDAANVYWLDPAAGTVSAMSKQGGPITLLAESQVSPAVIAVDPAFVYWGTPTSVLRAPNDGSSPPTIIGAAGTGFIGIDDSFVYTSTGQGNLLALVKVPKGGGASTSIPVTVPPGTIFGADNSGVYIYAEQLASYIDRIDTTTGVLESSGGGIDPTESVPLVVDAAVSIFPASVTAHSICAGSGFDYDLVGKFPYVKCWPEPGLDAGPPGLLTYLYPGANQLLVTLPERDGPPPASIARNQCAALWSTGGWSGVGGGTLGMGVAGTMWAASLGVQAEALYVAVDESFVYWTDASGAIGKLPLP